MLNIVGFDPSLRSWGLATATWSNNSLKVTHVDVIKTKNTQSKNKPQNISDMECASFLYSHLTGYVRKADVICIELPNGSQGSRPSVSYATCTALVGALATLNPNIIIVTPMDIKKIVRETKEHKPTKQDVIAWVKTRHPEANISGYLNYAEHQADAVVSIHAAMLKPDFKGYL